MNLRETYIWRDHLWIVISLPDETGALVLVNFTTWKENKDQSCVVEPGDHPFIKNKTVVAYKNAWVCTAGEQNAFLRSAQQREDVSEALLQRIQEGTDSDFIPQKAKRLVEESCRKQRAAKKA